MGPSPIAPRFKSSETIDDALNVLFVTAIITTTSVNATEMKKV
jgi:hypothetical protein